MKPLLAENIDFSKLKYPLIGSPKIDGVRGCNQSGILLGRSLKQHENKHTTRYFSRNELSDIDGELHLGNITTLDNLCMLTSSALSTIEETPDIHWTTFDLAISGITYEKRLVMLEDRIKQINDPKIHLIESTIIENFDELIEFDTKCLQLGYEGTCFRNPLAEYKEGRSTSVCELVRLKRFIEEEAIVLSVIEGTQNNNEKQINELGRSFRSSHQSNLIPNGMVGGLWCKLLKDVYFYNKLLYKADTVFKVAPGIMTKAQRLHYFIHQNEIVGHVIKFKTFPRGVKDLPRFPTFQSIRIKSDIGE